MQSNKLNGDLIRVSVAVAILCLLLVGTRMRGQDKADLTVRVKVVNVPATVRDKHGKIVNNLTKDDFVLEEDGRPQTLRYFSQENNLPLTLGLLVDTSMSQRRVLGQERTASSSFIDQMLRPEKDKAFLIHFDHEVELDQDLTSSERSCDPRWIACSRRNSRKPAEAIHRVKVQGDIRAAMVTTMAAAGAAAPAV